MDKEYKGMKRSDALMMVNYMLRKDLVRLLHEEVPSHNLNIYKFTNEDIVLFENNYTNKYLEKYFEDLNLNPESKTDFRVIGSGDKEIEEFEKLLQSYHYHIQDSSPKNL